MPRVENGNANPPELCEPPRGGKSQIHSRWVVRSNSAFRRAGSFTRLMISDLVKLSFFFFFVDMIDGAFFFCFTSQDEPIELQEKRA